MFHEVLLDQTPDVTSDTVLGLLFETQVMKHMIAVLILMLSFVSLSTHKTRKQTNKRSPVKQVSPLHVS